MKLSGITALAHPLDPKTATRHGVFVLEDIDMIRRKYKKGDIKLIILQFHILHQLEHTKYQNLDPTFPLALSKVKRFLHKVSIETMKESHAIIPESNKVS